MKTVNIKFKGVDDWNRPVFKDVDSRCFYGNTTKLFGWADPTSKIIDYFKNHIDELEYFGNSFGCEPNGGISKNITLNIID